MIVVSDATPLHALIQLGLVHLLADLYGNVVIPPAVSAELRHERAPADVRTWMSAPPEWLSVRTPSKVDPTIVSGAGEREAICLALEIKADLLLVDDKEARRAARQVSLPIIGTIGILELAAARNLIELRPAIESLSSVGSYVDPKIIRRVLDRDTNTPRGS